MKIKLSIDCQLEDIMDFGEHTTVHKDFSSLPKMMELVKYEVTKSFIEDIKNILTDNVKFHKLNVEISRED